MIPDTGWLSSLLAVAREGLRGIGYRSELLLDNYRFSDFSVQGEPVRKIELAAFAQEPPSLRNACIGVAALPELDSDAVRPFRSLGAPQVLGLHPKLDLVSRWKMTATGSPVLLEQFRAQHLMDVLLRSRDEWRPEEVLRAKSISYVRPATQLDFFDAGLIPALESVIHEKLDQMLRRVITTCRDMYQERNGVDPDYAGLFRLIFRLLAAKLLSDRQHPGLWGNPDATMVIPEVERFYSRDPITEPVLSDPEVQQAAWHAIREGLHFQNLSVEALAYVYEHTLVSEQARALHDIHATPAELAEYIVQQLPFDELSLDNRHVFEPFAGHAPFLIAALGRLRALLPSSVNSAARHKYFVKSLSGIEIDPFAREVALQSLILADYPNPDGWDILQDDAFKSKSWSTYLERANVVLCNPPYGDFSVQDRLELPPAANPNKAVEALRRVLERPPAMLGFVLPRVFTNGVSYRDVHRTLAATYDELQVVGIPDVAFRHSEIETALLIAFGRRSARPRWRTALVARPDYRQFALSGEPTWHTECVSSWQPEAGAPQLWRTPFDEIWDELAELPKLESYAEVHRGIEYGISVRDHISELAANYPRPGFQPGILNVADGFEPYVLRSHRYLNTDPRLMRGSAYTLPWERPKLIVNAARLMRGPWPLAAAIDEDGLFCYQNFHGVWPKDGLPLEVLAAVLNSPVANAFVNSFHNKRHNQKEYIKSIPMPPFSESQVGRLVQLVQQYQAVLLSLRDGLGSHMLQEGRRILELIDAEVLTAYDLSPRLERRLLDLFTEDNPRPGRVPFLRYYPEGFRSSIPWRIFISDQFRASSAVETMARLPIIHDPIISEAVAALVDEEGETSR